MSAVGFVVATVLGFALATTFGPLVANLRFRPTREPTAAERARIDAARERAEADPDRTYVGEPVGEASVDVRALGVPGYRVLVVTDYVLGELDDATVAGLLAAETGRVRTLFAEYRTVAIAAVVGILSATFVRLIPFEPGFVALGGAALAAFAVGRRLQFRADALAADAVGAAAVADAFETVADVRGIEPETSTWRTLFEVQPPLGDRIARLRERAA